MGGWRVVIVIATMDMRSSIVTLQTSHCNLTHSYPPWKRPGRATPPIQARDQYRVTLITLRLDPRPRPRPWAGTTLPLRCVCMVRLPCPICSLLLCCIMSIPMAGSHGGISDARGSKRTRGLFQYLCFFRGEKEVKTGFTRGGLGGKGDLGSRKIARKKREIWQRDETESNMKRL